MHDPSYYFVDDNLATVTQSYYNMLSPLPTPSIPQGEIIYIYIALKCYTITENIHQGFGWLSLLWLWGIKQ